MEQETNFKGIAGRTGSLCGDGDAAGDRPDFASGRFLGSTDTWKGAAARLQRVSERLQWVVENWWEQTRSWATGSFAFPHSKEAAA